MNRPLLLTILVLGFGRPALSQGYDEIADPYGENSRHSVDADAVGDQATLDTVIDGDPFGQTASGGPSMQVDGTSLGAVGGDALSNTAVDLGSELKRAALPDGQAFGKGRHKNVKVHGRGEAAVAAKARPAERRGVSGAVGHVARSNGAVAFLTTPQEERPVWDEAQPSLDDAGAVALLLTPAPGQAEPFAVDEQASTLAVFMEHDGTETAANAAPHGRKGRAVAARRGARTGAYAAASSKAREAGGYQTAAARDDGANGYEAMAQAGDGAVGYQATTTRGPGAGDAATATGWAAEGAAVGDTAANGAPTRKHGAFPHRAAKGARTAANSGAAGGDAISAQIAAAEAAADDADLGAMPEREQPSSNANRKTHGGRPDLAGRTTTRPSDDDGSSDDVYGEAAKRADSDTTDVALDFFPAADDNADADGPSSAPAADDALAMAASTFETMAAPAALPGAMGGRAVLAADAAGAGVDRRLSQGDTASGQLRRGSQEAESSALGSAGSPEGRAVALAGAEPPYRRQGTSDATQPPHRGAVHDGSPMKRSLAGTALAARTLYTPNHVDKMTAAAPLSTTSTSLVLVFTLVVVLALAGAGMHVYARVRGKRRNSVD